MAPRQESRQSKKGIRVLFVSMLILLSAHMSHQMSVLSGKPHAFRYVFSDQSSRGRSSKPRSCRRRSPARRRSRHHACQGNGEQFFEIRFRQLGNQAVDGHLMTFCLFGTEFGEACGNLELFSRFLKPMNLGGVRGGRIARLHVGPRCWHAFGNLPDEVFLSLGQRSLLHRHGRRSYNNSAASS